MLSLEQEKQGGTRKKQEKTSKKQELAIENKKNKVPIPLYEAKRQVFSLIQKGLNYREISKATFLIVGLGLKRFSISEISKIKSELVGGSHYETSNKSRVDKSRLFQLIKNGTRLEDIVITMGLEPAVVKEAYDEYLELESVSALSSDKMIGILRKKGISCEPDSLIKTIQRLADAHQFLDVLSYPCCDCGNLVSLSPFRDNEDWSDDIFDAINFLKQEHGHKRCPL